MGKEPVRHGEIYVCGVTATLISIGSEFLSGPFEKSSFLKNAQKYFRARPGPDRAQKYFCQNFESVTIPEAPGRFLKKSENENS